MVSARRTTAVIYARVSSDPRGRGRSVADQEAECRAVCDRESWSVARVFVDNDRSASRYSTKARPEFDRLVHHLRSGKTDVLVTWEASRLQRDLAVYVELRELCRERGVLWSYSGRTYDLSRTDDRLSTGLDALLSERESDMTRERVLRAVRSRAVRGRPHGRLTYGLRRLYDPETGDYRESVPDPEIAPIVVEVFSRVARGDSPTGVARDLTRRGVPTPRTSAVWRGSTIRNLIVNRAYLGERRMNGEMVAANAWPSLVDTRTWRTANARLSDPTRPGRRDSTVRALLSGVATCGICNGKLYATNRLGPYPTYSCHDRRCLGRSMRCLDDYVTGFVITLVDSDDRIRDQSEDAVEQDTLTVELDELRNRLGGFVEAAAAGEISPASLAGIEEKLLPKIADVEQTLVRARHSNDLPDLGGKTLAEVWETLDLAQQRDIIRATVDVVVLPVGAGKRFDPAGVRTTPRTNPRTP